MEGRSFETTTSVPFDGSTAAPPQLAVVARHLNGVAAVGRREQTVVAGAEDLVAKAGAVFQREIGAEVVDGKFLTCVGRRFCREGLRGPGGLARHVGFWNGALFDGPDGLAGDAVEDPHEALLADLRNSVDRFSVLMQCEELRGGGIVVIPDVVMHHLKMPEALAGAGVESEEAVGEEIGSSAVDAVEIVFRAGSGRIDDPTLFVERELTPDIGAADSIPCAGRPCFVTELAGMRDGVEGPDDAAGANVEGSQIAGRGAIALIGGRAQDEQVFENAAGRS